MSRLEGKVLVAQGGGPTAVINQSVVGVTLEARKFTQVKAVYGAIHGVQGIVKEDFLDLTRETTHNLEQVARDALVCASFDARQTRPGVLRANVQSDAKA